MVQTRSTGIIVDDNAPIGIDGGERVSVKWDNTGITNDWNERFLRPFSTSEREDPDEIVVGKLGRRKASFKLDQFGLLIVKPEGFFEV